MKHLGRYLHEKHGIRTREKPTLEDLMWWTLGAVAALFFMVFAAAQLYAKVSRPEPAVRMSPHLTMPACDGGEFRIAQKTLAQCGHSAD